MPIIKISDLDEGFVVCTNSCLECLGRVLMQENSVVVYESRKLKPHVKHYAVYHLKRDDIIHALKCCDTTCWDKNSPS